MAKKGKKENLIGKVIYGTLMFAPLLAILSSCTYSNFNKNATEQMTRTITQQPTELVEGNWYHINTDNTYRGTQKRIGYTEIANLEIVSSLTINPAVQGKWFDSRADGWLLDTPEGYYANFVGSFDFKFLKIDDYTEYLPYLTETITYTETRDLRNTFYYSVEQINEQQLFNWAKDNDIYTGIKVVTDGLNITTDVVPLILTYWLIMSLIYFIYDMILMILNMLHNKIHECQNEL